MLFEYLSRNRLRVLMYHSISSDGGDRLTVTPEMFAAQMRFLNRDGFQVLSLQEGCERLYSGGDLSRAIVLTFDDGYRDFLTEAVPVLEKSGFPATLFVVTQMKDAEWRKNGNRTPLLSWDEVGELKARGFSIGSHSATHADLPSLKESQLERELVDSHDAIAGLGETFVSFAYPGGRFTARERDAVASAGYDCAVVVGGRWGNGSETDRFLIKREPMLASDSFDWFKNRVNGYYEA